MKNVVAAMVGMEEEEGGEEVVTMTAIVDHPHVMMIVTVVLTDVATIMVLVVSIVTPLLVVMIAILAAGMIAEVEVTTTVVVTVAAPAVTVAIAVVTEVAIAATRGMLRQNHTEVDMTIVTARYSLKKLLSADHSRCGALCQITRPNLSAAQEALSRGYFNFHAVFGSRDRRIVALRCAGSSIDVYRLSLMAICSAAAQQVRHFSSKAAVSSFCFPQAWLGWIR